MRIHVLERSQRIERPIAEVFPFYADAGNLERITPPWLGFEVTSERPIEMRAGALMTHFEGNGAKLYLPRDDRDYAIHVGLRMLVLRRLVEDKAGLLSVVPGAFGSAPADGGSATAAGDMTTKAQKTAARESNRIVAPRRLRLQRLFK